ncbi:hypothetical protein TYRP_005759, partial [Tyrophagus putrescentiae]
MSPRCAVLVRAANRTVKTLVITAVQPLMGSPDEPSFPDYPLTVSARLSKWHCLVIDPNEQIDTAFIEQIVYIFSAVTDLKFITYKNGRLVMAPLLQHPNWQCQLTNFMAHTTMGLDGQQSRELISAINGLTALQCLAFHWYGYTDLPDLSILAQLKVVVFESGDLSAFVRSLEQYATDNADLQVHLISPDIDSLLSLNQPLHSRIVRYGTGYDYTDDTVLFPSCSQFRSLTSLFIECIARPLAQLNTLRALELHLTISSHSQVQWLNLPVTMPNLQTIYIVDFYCRGCHVEIDRYIIRNSSPLNSSKAINCLQSSLFTLHSGVPLNRLIFHTDKEGNSAEILLLHQQLSRQSAPVSGDEHFLPGPQSETGADISDLPILAQLKVVVFKSEDLSAFVHSLKSYAADNADLQVHLFALDTDVLLSLSQPLRSRIVCCDDGNFSTPLEVPHLCGQFSSLTSFTIGDICKPTEVVPMFTALSQLHQLVLLELGISWDSDEEFPPARPLAQLKSLRALGLGMTIALHSQLEWLNLSWTLPHLKTIYTEDFEC